MTYSTCPLCRQDMPESKWWRMCDRCQLNESLCRICDHKGEVHTRPAPFGRTDTACGNCTICMPDPPLLSAETSRLARTMWSAMGAENIDGETIRRVINRVLYDDPEGLK